MTNPFIKTESDTQNIPRDIKLKSQLFSVGFIVAGVALGGLAASRLVDISITPKQKISAAQSGAPTPAAATIDTKALESEVLPLNGVTLPIVWKDFGKRMIADGVIDETKFRAIFQSALALADESMLTGKPTGQISLNSNNSRFILDILWAFGLANKNAILEKGEMTDKQYGGAGNFASTGGWTLAKGKTMDHYSKHLYVTLTPGQQELVDKVSRNIFRPCCGNSTHFPDCNHGMAMLGLLELMAANNVSEAEMYRVALAVNSYWFPQTYLDLAAYFKEQGKLWKEVDPQVVLSSAYSSSGGYQNIRSKIQSLPQPANSGGGGCGT